MNISRFTVCGCLIAVALGLAGCADLSKAMSSLESEDSTQAIKAPPLSLPPDYNLRPPVPGGRGDPNRVNVDQARQNMFGTNTPKPDEGVADTRSAGEAALLSKAVSPGQPVADIRTEVDQETESLKEDEGAFVDKMLNWDEDGAAGEATQDDDFLKSIIVSDETPVIKRK